MFRLVEDQSLQRAARKHLRETFMIGAKTSINTFTTPAGGYKKVETFTRKDLGIWGSIGTGIGNKTILAFGVGEPTWQIGIEITIPQGRSLHANGQLVKDEHGKLFLAHSGGLGGGKHSVARDKFASQIVGFSRTPVFDGDDVREMFVLAAVDQSDDMPNLADYIREAKRIRDVRREEVTKGLASVTSSAGGKKQNDEGGWYERSRLVEFEQRHGMVQNSLEAEMKQLGLDTFTTKLSDGLRADLVSRESAQGPGFLFEIKAATGAQPHFTGVGQLLVYGEGHQGNLRKVLVTADDRLPLLLKEILDKHQIMALKYKIVGKFVHFRELKKSLGLK